MSSLLDISSQDRPLVNRPRWNQRYRNRPMTTRPEGRRSPARPASRGPEGSTPRHPRRATQDPGPGQSGCRRRPRSTAAPRTRLSSSRVRGADDGLHTLSYRRGVHSALLAPREPIAHGSSQLVRQRAGPRTRRGQYPWAQYRRTTPRTMPCTWQNFTRIGSKSGFAGWRRM